jgi:DNA repair protein RecO (recombination protein O)
MLFCWFYLNEIVLRLCPLEEAMPQTFEQYQLTLLQLQQLSSHENPDLFLRQILRQFEHVLLPELGYAIDFSIDTQQKKFCLTVYQFQVTEGLPPLFRQVVHRCQEKQFYLC